MKLYQFNKTRWSMKALYVVALLFAAPAFSQLPVSKLPAPGEPGAPNDKRYCGEPERHPNGRIKRDQSVLWDFAEVFPCPRTLVASPEGCTGWQMNHTIPRARGGCHSVANLTWLPVQIKTCTAKWCVDRWELQYHEVPRRAVVIPSP